MTWRRDDLDPVEVADLEPGGSRSAAPTRTRTRLTVNSLVLALLAVVAASFVFIAWQEYRQTRIQDQQLCITKAEQYQGIFGPGGNTSAAATDLKLARCLQDPLFQRVIAPVVIPGVVSLHLAEAKRDIAMVGLTPAVQAGDPSDDNAVVTAQEPSAGVAVPAGSALILRTRSP